MKKILASFIALFIITFTVSCEDNFDNEDPIARKPIVGKWQPLKVVENVVYYDGAADSETHVYDDCERQSVYTFNENLTGNITTFKLFGTDCLEDTNQNMKYTYDLETGKVNIKFLTYQQNGEALMVTDSTMNLKVEEIVVDDSDPNNIIKTYISETYTLKKIQ